jgi:hypothetical protein
MCGVFGVRAPARDVARLAYFGLHALQHRGQESAGIAVSEHGRLTTLRDLGLVTQVFDERKLSALHGELAIGHTRYSTTGSNAWANAQPVLQHGRSRTVALGHSRNLINAAELRTPRAESASSSDSGRSPLIANERPLAEAIPPRCTSGAPRRSSASPRDAIRVRDARFRPLVLAGWATTSSWPRRPRPRPRRRALRARRPSGKLVLADGRHTIEHVLAESSAARCASSVLYLAARTRRRRRGGARADGRAAHRGGAGRRGPVLPIGFGHTGGDRLLARDRDRSAV